jgi:hypothetical protein
MQKHGNHSLASQVHAAERARNESHAECCANAKAEHDAIAHRAYDIYVKDGCKPGHCNENWRKAEYELQTANHRG